MIEALGVALIFGPLLYSYVPASWFPIPKQDEPELGASCLLGKWTPYTIRRLRDARADELRPGEIARVIVEHLQVGGSWSGRVPELVRQATVERIAKN